MPRIIPESWARWLSGADLETKAADRPPYTQQAGGGIPSGILDGTARTQLAQMQAYGENAWVHRAVQVISQAIAATDWHLFRQNNRTGDRVDLEQSHPLRKLWLNPNPFFTRHEFLERTGQHGELAGEAFWWVLADARGIPVELWPLRPDRVTPVPDKDNFIKGYVYQIGQDRIPLEVADVIHIPQPSPLDMYRGIGVTRTILEDASNEEAASQYARSVFRNSARPGGVVKVNEGMHDAEWERMRERWKAQHQGSQNAFRTVFLDNAEWQDVRQFTAEELQFTELRRYNRDVILGAFGIPRSVVGITEDVNRSNAEAGETTFYRWVLTPRLERIKQVLNKHLVSRFGTDLELDYNDPTPEDRERLRLEATQAARARLITVNEARQHLGWDAIEGGDEFLEQEPADLFSLGDQSRGMERKSQESVKDSDPRWRVPGGVQEEAARGLAWQAEHGGGTEDSMKLATRLAHGDEVSGETARSVADYLSAHEDDKHGGGFKPDDKDYPSPARIEWALHGGNPGQRWSGKVLAKMENREINVEPGDDPLIEDEADRASVEIERGWRQRFRAEADNVVEQLLGDTRSVSRQLGGLSPEDADRLSLPWVERYTDEVVREIERAFMAGATATLGEDAAALQVSASQHAAERGASLLRVDGSNSLQKLTRRRVRQIISTGIDEGIGPQQLARRIRADVAFSRSRSVMVARTETRIALGQAKRQIAVQRGEDEKRWFTQADDHVHQGCRDNGAAGWIPRDESFPSGADITPDHPSCRCTVQFRRAENVTQESLVAEPRCPQCNKRLGASDVPGYVRLWCDRCKTEHKAEDCDKSEDTVNSA